VEFLPDTSSRAVRFRVTLSRITLTAAPPDCLEKLCAFFSSERFPRPRHQSVKRHLHDPNTMQREYPISQNLAHAPNLSIAPFGKNDTESRGTDSFDPAGVGRTLKNDNPLCHPVDKRLIEWMID
jgi:hypothetical protein